MAFFTILGRPDCANFVHALIVAEHLEKHLPGFRYKKIEQLGDDLREEVERANIENGWSFSVSDTPIIWKEITDVSVKKHLIGGLGEFWEYCLDYYGLEPSMTKEDLQEDVKENMAVFKENSKRLAKFKQVVSIIGMSSPQLEFIIEELPQAFNLKPEEVNIRIYVSSLYLISELYKEVLITDSFENLLDGSDLLIILEDYSQHPGENQLKWLNRVTFTIGILGEKINFCAERGLRIILSHPGCTCLTATTLMAHCTNILANNIVAVTADAGLEALNHLSKATCVPVAKMGGAPVWGWPGIVDFIDIEHIVIKAEIITPFQRAVIRPMNTLPEACLSYEFRLSKYLINKKVETEMKHKKNSTARALKRAPILGKVRSLISLIKFWYSNDHESIISLGVCSNGSFGLPVGVIISQPVELTKKKIWRPFTPYPIKRPNVKKIRALADPIRRALCIAQVSNPLCNCENCMQPGYE